MRTLKIRVYKVRNLKSVIYSRFQSKSTTVVSKLVDKKDCCVCEFFPNHHEVICNKRDNENEREQSEPTSPIVFI